MTTGVIREDILGLMRPLPRQREFLQASLHYRFLLYGGSRGPGKSYILRWGLLWRLLDWQLRLGLTRLRVGLFCEDYPTLRDRQISRIDREFPGWLGELKDTQEEGLGFHLPERYGGHVILLRNLDDPSKYAGGEFAGIAVDELTRNTKETFDMLRGSLRWPGIADTFFWAASMPTGRGLAWVRDLWVERQFPPELAMLAPEFHFIRALPHDNPYLDETYWQDLRSQPPHVQRAWIEGDWHVPVGVMFDELDAAMHQVEAGPPRRATAKCIAMDWGFHHRAAAGWFETDDTNHTRLYREFVAQRLHPALFAAQVVAHSEGEDVRRVVLDPAAWAKAQDGSISPAEQMQATFHAAGMVLVPAVKGPLSRRHGITLLHTYLYAGWPGGPLLTISRNCPEAWRELTSLIRGEPPEDPDDIAKGQVDDCFDMLRYFVQSRPEPAALAPDLAETALGPDARLTIAQLERARAKRLMAVRLSAGVKKSPRRNLPPWMIR